MGDVKGCTVSFYYDGPGKDALQQLISGHMPASLHPLELPLIQLHRLSA